MQSLLLAGPGVGIGTILMALFARYCLPYNWSWNLSMVFGSILAATDPVAVVALLKNVGASPKLTILIIGESLMNDGTAMVLFSLFFNMIKGDSYDFGGIVGFFVSMTLGAPLLGIGFGVVSVWLLGKANRSMSADDTTIQIAITFCCAYLVFFTAEYECKISGILACCGAGCVFAWKAPPLILEHETMHHVWGMIEWIANTIIFMLAGLIIGKQIIQKIEARDWGYLFLLYIILQLIRCLVVAVLYPFLSKTGLKCSRKDAIFVSWAGLRGALAMCLSLLVFEAGEDYESIGVKDGDRVFFFVGGIAALTISVNAVFASSVLEYLGLLTKDESPNKVTVLKQIKKRLRKKLLSHLQSVTQSMQVKEISEVIRYNQLLVDYVKSGKVDEEWVRDSLSRADWLKSDSDISTTDRSINFFISKSDVVMMQPNMNYIQKDLCVYVRSIFLEIVRVQYWKQIECGKLPREGYATETMLYSIEYALDRVDEVFKFF